MPKTVSVELALVWKRETTQALQAFLDFLQSERSLITVLYLRMHYKSFAREMCSPHLAVHLLSVDSMQTMAAWNQRRTGLEWNAEDYSWSLMNTAVVNAGMTAVPVFGLNVDCRTTASEEFA